MFFIVQISHLKARRCMKKVMESMSPKTLNMDSRVHVWSLKHYFWIGLKAAPPTRRDNMLSMRCLIHRNAASVEATLLTVLRTVSMFLTKHWTQSRLRRDLVLNIHDLVTRRGTTSVFDFELIFKGRGPYSRLRTLYRSIRWLVCTVKDFENLIVK